MKKPGEPGEETSEPGEETRPTLVWLRDLICAKRESAEPLSNAPSPLLIYVGNQTKHYKTLSKQNIIQYPLFSPHMGEISQGVQSLNLMSYLSGVLRPFFGDLGLCYGKN